MELAVLAAGIDARRQLGEQRPIEGAAGERLVEYAGIDADERCFEAEVDEFVRELGRIATPDGEQRATPDGGEAFLPVGADVLEEEVAEGDGLHQGERRRRAPDICEVPSAFERRCDAVYR